MGSRAGVDTWRIVETNTVSWFGGPSQEIQYDGNHQHLGHGYKR